jgi:alpha/beta superfamily hydrolase
MKQREIDGVAGRLEARLDEPDGPARGVAVMAPPHPELGGTLHDRVVYHATQGLKRAGFAVFRFNFRGAGASAGRFSGGPGELDDFRSAIDAAVAEVPGVPVWAVGYSFGAWVALTAGAADARVETLVAISPPVGRYDFDPARDARKPTFVVHGERDELAPLKAVQRFYGTLDEPRELIVIDGADHGFDGHASEVGDALEDLAR